MHSSLIPADQIEDFIILHARKFTSTVRRKLTRDVLDTENLSVLEWQLLFSVARFGSCHVAYLTKHTSIDPAHGSRSAASLETKGLIERREDPQNKKCKLISLTQNGVRTFERIWPLVRQVTKSVTDQLDPIDFQEIKRLLQLLTDATSVLDEDNFSKQHKTAKNGREKNMAVLTS